jgi:glycosyltransferase involved in cell wall biosynthesis
MIEQVHEPKVSVCIPVYNGARFIASAIESVLKQDYDDYELIIVDDCSTDNSSEICSKYLKERSSIHYHKNEKNLGITRNWNTCVSLARGKYVLILHQDDQILEGALKSQSEVMEKYPEVGVVFGNTNVVYLPGEKKILRPGWDTSFIISGRDFGQYMLTHLNIIYCPSVMIRKSYIIEFGPFDERFEIFEDYEMWLRLALGNTHFAYLSRPTALYTYHQTNTSQRVVRECLNIDEQQYIFDGHQEKIREIYKEQAENLLNGFRQTFAYLCLGYALNLIYNGHHDSAAKQLDGAVSFFPDYRKHRVVKTLNILNKMGFAGRAGVLVIENFLRFTGLRKSFEKKTYSQPLEIPKNIEPLKD